jgi:cyclophilin family peptidyl-prolyl cis-trans isomerase
MKYSTLAVAALVVITLILGVTTMGKKAKAQAPAANALENTLYMNLKDSCRVVIALRPDLAPTTVTRIKELVRQHFYDGVVFHRVIDGFMAQTGDPTGTGMGGSGKKLPDEFPKGENAYSRGVVAMANAGPGTSDSQFFIMLQDYPLPPSYTVFGKVTEGIECVDKIKKGNSSSNGQVTDPDKIVSMQMAVDVR